MLSILPAFSSPDLKVFLLPKKSFKSSEGGQGETVSEASASFRSSLRPSSTQLDLRSRSVPAVLRSSLQESATSATDSPDSRISVVAFVILSVGLCQSRKDRYLPPERLCVRLLPRPNGLASSRFQKISVTCYARAKNLFPPPRSRVLTDASASVLLSPPCSARRFCQRMCIYRIDVFTTTFSSRSKPPLWLRLPTI